MTESSITAKVSVMVNSLIINSIGSASSSLLMGLCRRAKVHVTVHSIICQCANLYSASLANTPMRKARCDGALQTEMILAKPLKATRVALGLRTGSGRLFRADGPAMAKARRPYVLSRSPRGTSLRGTEKSLAEQCMTH